MLVASVTVITFETSNGTPVDGVTLAVMVAVPSDTPVAFPDLSTVRILSSLEYHM